MNLKTAITKNYKSNRIMTMSEKILKTVLTAIIFLMSPYQTAIADAEFQQGINYFNKAEYSQAHSFLDELKSDFKSNAEFQYYYGLSLLKTDQAKEAVDALERAVELDPDNAEYHYALAMIYFVRGDELGMIRGMRMGRAVKRTLLKAVELDPQHAEATSALTSYLLGFPGILGGDGKAGRALLPKLRELNKSAALWEEGFMERRDGNFERAEELLIAAINTPGRKASYRVNLAKYYMDQKQYNEAIPYLEQSLGLPRTWSEDDGDSAAHTFLAACYYLLGDQDNFRKHALAAEETSQTEKDSRTMRAWFDHWKIEYD